MTCLAAMLAYLRDSEAAPERRRQFEAAVAMATRLERELAEATRALDALHAEAEEEAALAEREAARERGEDDAREAAILGALAGGTVIRFPRGRAGRYTPAPGAGRGVA
jgi:ferric-dicitrate binding protein FerR (iron transport regulator)